MGDSLFASPSGKQALSGGELSLASNLPAVLQGMFQKKAGKKRPGGGWKWRFFEFDTSAMCVSYYDSLGANSSKLKGEGSVAGAEDVPDRPGKRPHRFNLKLDYHVQRKRACFVEVAAVSATEKDRWMAVLVAAVRAKYLAKARAMQGPPMAGAFGSAGSTGSNGSGPRSPLAQDL